MQLSYIFRNILIIVLCLPAFAHAENLILLTGSVFDSYMHEPMEYATIRAYNLPDSTLLGECKADVWTGQPDGSDKKYTGAFYMRIKQVDSCAVEVSASGYSTIWKNISPMALGNRAFRMELKPFYMSPESHTLNEVEVKASLIKVYNKGDTLVFNADAFKLAEGSMLDALIEQLPGVELKDNGAIYVQGRYVESMLLNGKQFIGANNQLLLTNLPAYTVKDVQVYDKLGHASELAGANLGDSQYVLDVKLKKEFRTGINVNAEAGIGTGDRYLGRLFGMAFTPNNQYIVYLNANNLNDSRKPGQDTKWTPETMPTGVRRTILGGFDYSVSTEDKKWDVKGSASASHTREDDGTDRFTTNYLPDRNTYAYSFAKQRNKMLEMFTSHKIYWKQSDIRGTGLEVSPKLSYQKWDRSAESVNATFDKEYNEVTASFIESIYSGDNVETLKSLLNRELSGSSSRGHALNTSLRLWQGIRVGGGDLMSFEISGGYTNQHEVRGAEYDVRYGGSPQLNTLRIQNFNDHPNFSNNIGAKVRYSRLLFNNASVNLEYGLSKGYQRSTSMLNYLESSEAADNFTSVMLPSAKTAFAFDPSNSFIGKESRLTHEFLLDFNFQNSTWWIAIRVPLSVAHRHLIYDRGDIHANISNNRVVFRNTQNSWIQWKKDKHSVFFSWMLGTIEAAMPNLVDYTDTTNPLVTVYGNPNLKNALRINSSLDYSYRNSNRNERATIGVEYNMLSNAISMASDYDTATGKRSNKYVNIDGNYDISARASYYRQIGRFDFRNQLKYRHVKSVDMISQNHSGATRSNVFDNGIYESLKASYSFSAIRLGINFTGSYNKYTSNLRNFTNQNTWNFNTGINGVISLPAGFSLSADMTMYNRRGFTDKALNTDNFVLNARLSYSAMKGALLFMLDGYDILHDLSNVSYTVNAQGRTETYRTVLPRYFMAHVQWRFNHTPRRKVKSY